MGTSVKSRRQERGSRLTVTHISASRTDYIIYLKKRPHMVKSWPADPAKNYHTCKILTRLRTPRADRAVRTVRSL